MTVEITITTAIKDIPTWLRCIADFTEGIDAKTQTRQLYVKISEDC